MVEARLLLLAVQQLCKVGKWTFLKSTSSAFVFLHKVAFLSSIYIFGQFRKKRVFTFHIFLGKLVAKFYPSLLQGLGGEQLTSIPVSGVLGAQNYLEGHILDPLDIRYTAI